MSNSPKRSEKPGTNSRLTVFTVKESTFF